MKRESEIGAISNATSLRENIYVYGRHFLRQPMFLLVYCV